MNYSNKRVCLFSLLPNLVNTLCHVDSSVYCNTLLSNGLNENTRFPERTLSDEMHFLFFLYQTITLELKKKKCSQVHCPPCTVFMHPQILLGLKILGVKADSVVAIATKMSFYFVALLLDALTNKRLLHFH